MDTRAEIVHDTDARCRELWQKLTSGSEWSSPSGTVRQLLSRGNPANIPWAIGYRVSQMTGWAGDMDELLGSEKLTPEQRARLRSDLAAFCYTAAEPDVNQRGAMNHLGNLNMPINRFMGLAWAASLIPDHPMSKTWLDVSAAAPGRSRSFRLTSLSRATWASSCAVPNRLNLRQIL